MSNTFKIAIVARMKHGVLYEAIKKRGWTNKKAAEFLGVAPSHLSAIINLKKRPPFIFPRRKQVSGDKMKAVKFSERLMELTELSVEDLFPNESLTNEFLTMPKILVGMKDIPRQALIGTGAVPYRLPAPDDALLQKEVQEEVFDMIEQLPPYQRDAVKGLYLEGKTVQEMAQKKGVTKTAIYVAAHSGLQRLRRKIDLLIFMEDKNPGFNPQRIKHRLNQL